MYTHVLLQYFFFCMGWNLLSVLKSWMWLISLLQACFCKAGRMAWEAKDALGHALPAGLRAGADPSRFLAQASTWWEQAAHSSRAARIANRDLISWCLFWMLQKACWMRGAWDWVLLPFHAIGLAFSEVLSITGNPKQDMENTVERQRGRIHFPSSWNAGCRSSTVALPSPVSLQSYRHPVYTY